MGESLEQTVLREVKEETGLEVENPEHIDIVNNIIADEDGRTKYHFVIIDFFVKVKGGRLAASSDAEDLQWVGFDMIGKYDLTRTFKEFFERNREKLQKLDSYSSN